ncbi:MAG TPA: hypothetical protein VJ748_03050 [Vitreimonas sp.]|nr:hypothetical protein [Vitreimonas sp.]
MFRAAAVIALALLSSGPAAAQETAAPAEADDTVVVVGERTEEAIRGFVEAMSAPSLGANQLARWDRRICPGVAGLRTRYAQFVIDRLGYRALELDLEIDAPGCRPNILIVVSTNPDAIARELFNHHRSAMGYFDASSAGTRGRDALRATFVDSDAPVRWWHVSNTRSVGGFEFSEPRMGPACHQPARGADVLDIQNCYRVNLVGGGSSRLRATSRQDFGAAFIIVDANRLAEIGHDFNALADYLAMVSLAQLDPDADMSAYPSVLNLWRSADAPVELTDWDRDYLRGLYTVVQEARSARSQQGDIAREMMREGE